MAMISAFPFYSAMWVPVAQRLCGEVADRRSSKCGVLFAVRHCCGVNTYWMEQDMSSIYCCPCRIIIFNCVGPTIACKCWHCWSIITVFFIWLLECRRLSHLEFGGALNHWIHSMLLQNYNAAPVISCETIFGSSRLCVSLFAVLCALLSLLCLLFCVAPVQ